MFKSSKDYSGTGLLIGFILGAIISAFGVGIGVGGIGLFFWGPLMFIGMLIGTLFKKN